MNAQDLLTFDLPTRRATTRLGRWIAAGLHPGDLIILSGDLGMGKTFLVRAIARVLGVPTDVRVTSPTFALVHHYATSPPLIHADLYRIGNPFEVSDLGLLDMRSDGSLLFVEWGEPYLRELGGDALFIRLEWSSRGRIARLFSSGPRSLQWQHHPLPSNLLVRPEANSE